MNKTKCLCGKQADYFHRFESHYCKICNVWLEKRCDDPDCKYCVDRNKKPLNESHLPRVEGDGGLVSSRL